MTEQEILKQLEKRITEEYKDTEAVIREKIAYYTKDFAKDNKKYQQMVKDGLMSQKDYKNWYKNQMFAQKWSNKMASEIADDLTKATETASKIINNDTSKVYLQGLQEGVRELEPYDDFNVFDTRQIKKIADENAKHLPKANPNIPKEERWNEKRIRSSLMQSAIKGESVQKLAGRLRVVVGMGRTSAIRNARTMMTSSHNMGKLDLGKEAVDMGLDVRKKWIAIFDNRTRDSHALLHGEVVDMDEEFSNGLMYPADPDGDPAEVYNCRCNMVITHDAKRGGMSKEEFEQNVAENEAEKEAFKQANKDLKAKRTESQEDDGVIYHKQYGRGKIVTRDDNITVIDFDGNERKFATQYFDKSDALISKAEYEAQIAEKSLEEKEHVKNLLEKAKATGYTQDELSKAYERFNELLLKPQARYDLADMFTKEVANEDNFFMNSVGFWSKKSRPPQREPDHISINRRTGKISSQYWYTEQGVYRKSNHWGSDVASCSWYIDGRNYSREGVDVGVTETAFIEWKKLKAKGGISKSHGVYDLFGFEFKK